MLTAVVSILKIIGIIILVLLGILLCVVCLVLFVPVRYKAQGAYDETYDFRAKASWLLHIVSFLLLLEKDKPFQIKLRILGISVYDNLREKKEKPVKKRKRKEKKEKEGESEEGKAKQPQPEITAASLPEKEVTAESQNPIQPSATAKRNDKLPFWKKIIDFLKNIKYTIQKICDTIRNVKDNITYYTSLLKEESTLAAFASCKKQLFRVFRNLKPQKFHVKLHIGREDPAAMGDILGIWGMLYPLHMGHVELCPDFEQQIMEGSFYIKGRVTVFVFIHAVMILLFDKEIRHLKKCLTREQENGKENRQSYGR